MGVGEELLGRQVRCPHCKQVVLAPSAASNPAQPTGPAVSGPPRVSPPPPPPVVSPTRIPADGPTSPSVPPAPVFPPYDNLPLFNIPQKEAQDSIFGEANESEDEVFSSEDGNRIPIPELPPPLPPAPNEAGPHHPETHLAPSWGGPFPVPPPQPAPPLPSPAPVPTVSPPSAHIGHPAVVFGASSPLPAVDLQNPFAGVGAAPIPSPPRRPDPAPTPTTGLPISAGVNPWSGLEAMAAVPGTVSVSPPAVVEPLELYQPEPQPESVGPDRRSSRGSTTPVAPTGQPRTLFKIGVFLLLPYAALTTALAAYGLFFKPGGKAPDGHPLSTIPDTFGEFPAADRKKLSKAPFPVDQNLPPELKVMLGQKLPIGAVEVEPVKVEIRPLVMVGDLVRDGQKETLPPSRTPAVVLTLRIRNTSDDLTLHPMDPAFYRKPRANEPQPWTGLLVGKQMFWGGAIEWPFRSGVKRQYDAAQEADEFPLKPKESREYVVFTDTNPAIIKAVQNSPGMMLWRIQVRRGFVEYREKEVPVTAILGVEFRAADVKMLD